MPELSPTAILDPLVKGWAEEAGIPTEELSGILGGDIIGGIIGIPLDMFLTQLGSKIASGALGIAGLLFGTYTMKGQGRMQLDVMRIFSRLTTEILDPSPQQIKEIRKNIGDLIDGFVEGRWDKSLYAIIRNPREFSDILPGPAKETEKKTEEKEETASEKEKTKKTEQPTYPKGPGIVHKL